MQREQGRILGAPHGFIQAIEVNLHPPIQSGFREPPALGKSRLIRANREENAEFSAPEGGRPGDGQNFGAGSQSEFFGRRKRQPPLTWLPGTPAIGNEGVFDSEFIGDFTHPICTCGKVTIFREIRKTADSFPRQRDRTAGMRRPPSTPEYAHGSSSLLE